MLDVLINLSLNCLKFAHFLENITHFFLQNLDFLNKIKFFLLIYSFVDKLFELN